MKNIMDPWGTELVEDYQKVIRDFGLEIFNPRLFPQPNRLMRRHIVFAGRELNIISRCIKEKKPYYVLTGIMPSAERLHLGNKMVIEQLSYFQKHNAKTYVLVADLEAAATRGISLEEARKMALNFHIPAWIALGLNPEKAVFYFQSENKDVMRMAYEFAKKITLNEFKAVYGTADPGRIMSAMTQAADILYPQSKERMPGIVPVGIDQDPHIRLTRDIVRRTKAKNFFMPSSIYHKFMPSLDGSVKMSKSRPESCIELPEEIESVKGKIARALTGGRDTLEEHRRLGGQPEKCMVFELLKQHLVEDDRELDRIYADYKSGRMTSGEIKDTAKKKMEIFMKKFRMDIDKARKYTKKIKFVNF